MRRDNERHTSGNDQQQGATAYETPFGKGGHGGTKRRKTAGRWRAAGGYFFPAYTPGFAAIADLYAASCFESFAAAAALRSASVG